MNPFFLSNEPHNYFVTFEDVQQKVNDKLFTLIHILPDHQQSCLIRGTLLAEKEVELINDWVFHRQVSQHSIIVYGKNTADIRALEKKKRDLHALGFLDVYIYVGGLFEWLLLQDIYGEELFPTTTSILDILAFRPLSLFA
jgi:hypothetical protein